uniref:Uncharacterized protein n=1 Tax=Desertifilum tharense IPPAS B-1220 TaxID=1781255 RepID=A0ACD5GNT4_9CYAN
MSLAFYHGLKRSSRSGTLGWEIDRLYPRVDRLLSSSVLMVTPLR